MPSLIVLPTYNESENVVRLSRQIFDQGRDFEVLVVDDNSPDGTAQCVEDEIGHEPRLHLLKRERKLGLGTAYLAGFRYGLDRGYGQIITMDCDFSHDPAALPALLRASESFDLVIGSRYVAGGRVTEWPLHRRLLSRFGNLYTRTLLHLPVRDCTSGYRCYSRAALEGADPFGVRSSGYAFLEEMVWRVHRAGFRIVEVPIVFRDRRAGVSKIDRAEVYRAAWYVLRTWLRRNRPLESRTGAPGHRGRTAPQSSEKPRS